MVHCSCYGALELLWSGSRLRIVLKLLQAAVVQACASLSWCKPPWCFLLAILGGSVAALAELYAVAALALAAT